MTLPLPSDGISIQNRPALTGRRPGTPAAGKGPDAADCDQARLHQACADFEALLIQKLFQTMRAAIPKSGFIDSGPAEDIYTAMLDQQVAQDLALQGGLGLSTQIKEQIVRFMADSGKPND